MAILSKEVRAGIGGCLNIFAPVPVGLLPDPAKKGGSHMPLGASGSRLVLRIVTAGRNPHSCK